MIVLDPSMLAAILRINRNVVRALKRVPDG